MGSSMFSDMTQIGLHIAKKTSWKTLSCVPSIREVCIRCERSGIWMLESMIEDIVHNECVSESTMEMVASLVTYYTLIESREDESISSTSRDTKKYVS